MIEVKSHEFKGNDTHDRVDQALEYTRTGLVARMTSNPAGLGLLKSSCFLHGCVAYALGRIPAAIEQMEASCDCAAAMFAAASAPPNSVVTFPFRGALLTGPSGKPGFGSGPGTWVSDLLLAIARRRRDVVDILRDVPVGFFSRAPGERDACFVHWVAGLQLFLRGEDSKPQFARAELLSRTETLKVATPAIVNRYRVIGPALEAIETKDQLQFDQQLKASLEAFKKLYGRGKNATSSDSLIDPISAGLAVLGETRGLAIGVSSPYIPSWLIYPQPATP
jgi:Immunity protein 49